MELTVQADLAGARRSRRWSTAHRSTYFSKDALKQKKTKGTNIYCSIWGQTHVALGFLGGSDSKESTRVISLGWENPLEEGMATHSSILAWRIPWTEELSRLQPNGSQRGRQDLGIKHSTASHVVSFIYLLDSFNDLVIYSLSAFVSLDVFLFFFLVRGWGGPWVKGCAKSSRRPLLSQVFTAWPDSGCVNTFHWLFSEGIKV